MPPARFAHRKSHGYARSTSCGFVDLALLHFPVQRFEDKRCGVQSTGKRAGPGSGPGHWCFNFNASLLQALLDAVRRAFSRKASEKPAASSNAFSVAGASAAHDGVGNGCLEGSRLYGSTDETLELAQREGIVFQAYSPPLAARRTSACSGGEVDAHRREIRRTPAQVAMRWLVQQRVGAVSATANQHAAELLGVARFRLADGRHGGVVGADPGG